MTVISVRSIKDAVSKGTLIELCSDYRTARSVRALLPRDLPCAISAGAFRQHLQQATAEERRLGLQRLCAFLTSRMNLRGRTVPAAAPAPRAHEPPPLLPLKLDWFAPDKYWVVLMPDEAIQPLGKRA